MIVKTKYNIGDTVKVKIKDYKDKYTGDYYTMEIYGISIYSNGICYFNEYPEYTIDEEDIECKVEESIC